MIEQQHTTEDHRVQIASIGIDLGKTTFHLVALDARAEFFFAKNSPARNYWLTWRTCNTH
jgi:hypothetical protein